MLSYHRQAQYLCGTNKLTDINVMKALLIILAVLAFSLVLRIIDTFTSRRKINSVGAKSNSISKDMPKVDITNEEELKKALDHYRGMAD